MRDEREIFADKVAELFKYEESFKNFYGHVSFNIAGGECKNFKIEQVTLRSEEKKTKKT